MSEAAAWRHSHLSDLFSDDRLVRRATGGDDQAFGAIFRRYHQRLYRYCLALVGSPDDAHDALQNTMVKVLRALPGEERRIELKPWLYRIAHNESIDLLRRRRETAQIDPELIARGSGLAAEAEARERLGHLLADLEQLPHRQRGALVMRELGGLSYEEIGQALGSSAAVARQTLYEARLGLGQMEAGREMDCQEVTRALSDGDRRVARRRDLRAHLRECEECRRFGDRIGGRERDLAALSPLPAMAAAGLLQGLLGGNAFGGAGGLAGAFGAGAAKSLGSTAALKGAATVAAVAVIGVTAADRGGLIDAGLPGGGGARASHGAGAAPGIPVSGGDARAAAGAGAGAGALDGVAARRAVELARLRRAGSRADVAGATDTAAQATSAAPGSAAHPHRHGHEQQLPSAAGHGQRTAAEHKAMPAHGGSRAHHPKPAHPPRPAHPSHPAAPAAPEAPAGTGKGGRSQPQPSAPAPAPEAEAGDGGAESTAGEETVAVPPSGGAAVP
jgi:RNA polymerase sigma factor (sigma-70 family)